MTVYWNGLNRVAIPALFFTTDSGYEVDSGGVVTPISVQNQTTGRYLFWSGEEEDELFDYPSGTFSGETIIP